MLTVAELLDAPTGIGTALAGGVATDKEIQQLILVESLEGVGDQPPGALVVVSPAGLAGRPSYEFDVAVRRAATRGVAALLFAGCDEVPVTASHLAQRTHLALLTCRPETPLALVVTTLDHALRADATTTVQRALNAIDRVADLPPTTTVESILTDVSAALERAVAVSHDPGGHPVHVGGQVRCRLTTDHDDDATRLALPAVAAALGRWQERQDAFREAPQQARGEALTDLIVRESAQASPGLADRLRVTGLNVDATHVAACFTAATGAVPDAAELVRVRQHRDRLRSLVAANLPTGAQWSVSVVQDDVVVVRSGAAGQDGAVARAVSSLLDLVRDDDGATPVFAGLGSPQAGLEGLRQSATEARIAAAGAGAQHTPWVVSVFDATGVSRVLSEVVSSWVGRRVVAELLAPLDALGPGKAATSVETLSAYLDTQGSLQETARLLHLHPNAVAYRVRRIREVTGYDLTDPDMRFALHLACRSRLLATAV